MDSIASCSEWVLETQWGAGVSDLGGGTGGMSSVEGPRTGDSATGGRGGG